MIDLHIHSKFSDGEDSVEDIIKIAKEKNISTISLTDHDTTFGVAEIIKNAEKENIKVIPGVEISSVSNGHLIHILGYNIDINNHQLQELLNKISDFFNKSFYEQYSWMYKNNLVDIDLEKIVDYSSFKQSLALSDILKVMIANGEPYTLKDWPKFFHNIIKQYPGNNFIEKFPVHPAEAVEAINQAGGIAIFAHPARIKDADIKEMELLLPHGLGGVEVYYPFHDKALVNRYNEFAHNHNLIITGGTDWHGKDLTSWNAEIGTYGIENLNNILKKQ